MTDTPMSSRLENNIHIKFELQYFSIFMLPFCKHFSTIYRIIWNIKTEKPIKLVLQPEEEESKKLVLNSLNGIGDTVPETFASLGDITISLVDESSDQVITTMQTNFKNGGNYQIIIQYRDDDIFNVCISLKVLKYCIEEILT